MKLSDDSKVALQEKVVVLQASLADVEAKLTVAQNTFQFLKGQKNDLEKQIKHIEDDIDA